MSQLSSSQGQDPSRISIPLTKYSYSLSRITTKNYTWSHVTCDDINLVIRNFRAVDDRGNYTSRMVMGVTAGLDELETQDLGDVLACYNRFDPSTGCENPVRVVIRPPTWLAMVYPKGSADMFRFQLKFFNQPDFERAVTAFHDLGFSTKENPLSGPPRGIASSVPPPSSSPVPSIISSTSASSYITAATSLPRPASAMRSSPLSNEIAFGHTSISKLPAISDIEISENHRQASYKPFSTPHNPALSAMSTNMVPTVDPVRLYRVQQMQTEIGLERPAEVMPPHKLSDSQDVFLIPSSERIVVHGPLHLDKVVGEITKSPYFPNVRERLANPTASSSDPFTRLRESLDGPFTATSKIERPSSAPMERIEIQELVIPPQRVLPFPQAKKSRASSLAVLPPLPKPTPVLRSGAISRPPILPGMTVGTTEAKTTNKRVAQRKVAVQPAPSAPSIQAKMDNKIAIVNRVSTPPQGDVSPLAAKSVAMRPSSAAAVLESKATTARKRPAPSRPSSAAKRVKMVDQSTQTELFHGNEASHVAKRVESGHVSRSESASSPPEDYLATVDNFVTNHKSRPPPTEIYNTPQYRNASPEEREILVNNFICENLQNPDFIQLCKDATNSWRRIGLGM